jgi:membrane-associated phospholipid phosphatase
MKTYSLLNFFYRLPQNLLRVFMGRNLLWHALAFLLTYLSVVSGFDWIYFKYTQVPALRLVLFPAVLLGFFLPVIVPIVLLVGASITKNWRTLNTAFAIAQAALLGWFVSAFYKSLTGRPGPEHLQTLGDISRIFKFGFLRGGVFWGWPSSHTTVAFAVSLAVFTLYPENKAVKLLALIYAIYVGVAVSMTIHWFSDFLAGAIFGSLVGLAVGKSFLERYKALQVPYAIN